MPKPGPNQAPPIPDLTIAIWDDPVLSRKCDPVPPEEFGAGLNALGLDMLSVMKAGKGDGIGIAAPQVGFSKRLFVMKLRNTTEIIAVNPRVFPSGEYKTIEESCLSFPGLYGPVCRQDKCTLSYQDPVYGKETVLGLEGIDAHCAQHEADHLEGIMFFQQMPKHYRKKLLKQWKESH